MVEHLIPILQSLRFESSRIFTQKYFFLYYALSDVEWNEVWILTEVRPNSFQIPSFLPTSA